MQPEFKKAHRGPIQTYVVAVTHFNIQSNDMQLALKLVFVDR